MSARAKVMTFRTLGRTIIIVAAFPLMPMIVSGNWAWWEAWIYALVSILGFVISRVLAARQHPDLLEERARSMDLKDAKPWDKLLAPILAFGALWAYLATPVLLDSLWAFTPAFYWSVSLSCAPRRKIEPCNRNYRDTRSLPKRQDFG